MNKETFRKYLPVAMVAFYSLFIFLTFISPETLWATHDRELPLDPVWSYAVKAKGAAISGLLAGNILATYTQPLTHRFVPYLSCLIFQSLALLHHAWCFIMEPEGYFVKSDLHFQYVVIHGIGCSAFAFLAYDSKLAQKDGEDKKEE